MYQTRRGVEHTNQSTRHGKLEIVVLGEQRNHPGVDGLALNLSALVFRHDTGTDLNLVAEFQHTSQDTATGDTTLELLNLSTGLVDVEGTDDNHVRLRRKVTDGDGDLGDQVLVDGVDVELQLGGDGDDGRAVSNCAADEFEDRLVVRRSTVFPHQIDLVLEDDDVVELHDLNGGQMLAGLRLRTAFVAGDEQQSGVHDGGTRQHGAHENIVTGAVDEGHMAQQTICSTTPIAFTGRVDLFFALEGLVAGGAWTLGVVAFVDFGVGVTKLDGDIPFQLVLESDGLDAGYRLDHCTLSVSDMSNCADVDGGLTADDLWGKRV